MLSVIFGTLNYIFCPCLPKNVLGWNLCLSFITGLIVGKPTIALQTKSQYSALN